MKHLSAITTAAIIATMAMFDSCTKDETIVDVEPNDGPRVCGMTFNGGVSGYDNEIVKTSGTKASGSSWAEGDKIYITFFNDDEIVPGSATYSESNGWSVTYDGDLVEGSGQKCEVRYFVNPKAASEFTVSISPYTEIYETTEGAYNFSGNQLDVTANLSPKSGRIRFTGTASDVVYLTGITTYSTFSMATNSYSSTNTMIRLTVNANGTTPYVYGHFAYDDRKIALLGTDMAYTRICSSDIYKAGDSGYMAIPTDASHNNWKKGLYVTVNGVDFKLLPVAGNSSLGNYYVGETEVTEALWAAIEGGSSTSTYPVDNIDYPTIISWISKLNEMTTMSFNMLSKDEWLYAAHGGNKSQGYTYSGSNTPGDVAWYSSNCSAKQKVKTKAPNELGLYDMSGNVAEFTTTIYDYYPCFCGGGYKSTSDNIKYSSNWTTYYTDEWNNYSSSSHPSASSSGCKAPGVGFRLNLKCSPYL